MPPRGPKPAELGNDAEVHAEDPARVRCLTCLQVDARDGQWIKRGSLANHRRGQRHLNNVETLAAKQAQEAAAQAAQLDIYKAGTIPLQDANTPLHPQAHTSMFSNYDQPQDAYPDSGLDFGMSTEEEPIASAAMSAVQDDLNMLRTSLHEQYRHLLEEAALLDEFGEQDPDADFMEHGTLPTFADLESDCEENNEEELFETQGKYAPYANKVSMLLDIIDNLPRLRLSSSALKLIMWMLKQLKVPNVPSFNSFRKLQTNLREACGSDPTPHISDFGNHFSTNDIRNTIKNHFTNPKIASKLQFYPEEADPGDPLSESWQFKRWKEFKPAELTPMYSDGMQHFYIEEVAQLRDGRLVIPHDWVIRKKVLTAKCSLVTIDNYKSWHISTESCIVEASDFAVNYEVLAETFSTGIVWAEGSKPPSMPNPLRTLAAGDEYYVVLASLWADDVSGNRSKQYNKHINIYMVNNCLPGELLQQEYHVNFVSTSPHATALEQFKAIKDQIISTHTVPIRCKNAATGHGAAIAVRVPGLPADNPQQSEEASHMIGNANYCCRRCHAGGDYKQTEADAGYHALYESGRLRSTEEIKKELEEQLKAAMTGVAVRVAERQTASGTKDKITEYWIAELIQRSRELKKGNRSIESVVDELSQWLEKQPGEKMNPLLNIEGLDPTQDTPVEILHTILLGVVKYAWHLLHTTMSDADQELFTIRLQSTDTDGMTTPAIRAAYMMQYRNNLIGKHFKTLMQTMPFHLHGLTSLSPAHFTLVKAVGELGAFLWVPVINDLELYLNDLEICIGNVLDAFALIDPSKILVKIKLHLLSHLLQDVPRFGLAIRNSTEVFEAFNGIFRLCSIYSNHQSPSHDIANKFASMERLKHILSGGFWPVLVNDEEQWIQAAPAVRNVLQEHSILQRHLGWAPSEITVKSQKNARRLRWQDTLAAHASLLDHALNGIDSHSEWVIATYVRGVNGDQASIGSWVIVKANGKQYLGRIVEIASCATLKSDVFEGTVTVDEFELGEDRHPDLSCPILRRPNNGVKHISVPSSAVQFVLSVQHDCITGKCKPTAFRHVVQERQTTQSRQKLIEHSDDDRFVVNMFALHNAALLRQFIPRQLAEPRPLFADREARHKEIAHELRRTQTEKRKRTQEKNKATRERNAAAKKLAENSATRSVPSQHEAPLTLIADGRVPNVEADDDSDPEEIQPRAKRARIVPDNAD